MNYIWAPWRVQYIRVAKPKGCILCDKPSQRDDAANFILFRGKHNFVIMNAYPYNPGHLMVAPYRHVGMVESLAAGERNEHFEMLCRCVEVLKEVFHPEGFNTGMNLGKAAGAGIDDHIHSHVVPRWNGDTNFMPVIAGTKVVSEAMSDTYLKLQEKFGSIRP